MNDATRLKLEMSVIRAALKAGLKKGYVVSVYDGGEWVVKYETNLTKIVKALRSSSEDIITFRKPDLTRVGSLFLVYGNMPYEVINDHTDSEEMDAIYKAAEVVADKIEARS